MKGKDEFGSTRKDQSSVTHNRQKKLHLRRSDHQYKSATDMPKAGKNGLPLSVASHFKDNGSSTNTSTSNQIYT